MKPLSSLENISKTFNLDNKQDVLVLKNINLSINEGEFIALLGPSGSGKSTLLRILSGLIEATEGVVKHHEQILTKINPDMAIVFQSFALYPWLTVAENVQIGLQQRNLSPAEEKKEIEKALDLIGLGGHENAFPKELSGGMRQRVGFARAFVAKPEILAMDEPFSALDVYTAVNLRAEIIRLWQNGAAGFKSAFMVTHNIQDAVSMATRIFILSSHPGTVIYELQNELSFPRNEKSPEFQKMVDDIHDMITSSALPDPHLPNPHQEKISNPILPPHLRIESLPPVSAGRMMGLLETIHNDQGVVDIFDLSVQMHEEFGLTIAMTNALEILGFVETPKHDVLLTSLGAEFVHADIQLKKQIFSQQIKKLSLFKILFSKLDALKIKDPKKGLTEESIQIEIAEILPYENSQKIFKTIVDWGRFAEILDYDFHQKIIYRVEL